MKRLQHSVLACMVGVISFGWMGAGALAQEKTADEIALELSNPATPMSSLFNNLEYKTFKGDLPGADSQESLVYSFQPSLPFDLGEGRTFALRPVVPLILQQPVFNAEKGTFKDESGLGDIAFDSFLGRTSPSGLVTMYGIYGVLPTATEDTLGKDQWMLGPEFVVAKIGKKGIFGGIFFHAWDVAGEDDFDTSLSSLQYIYALNLGGGYQLASGPTITYDWEADSGQEWTVPLGIGVAKTQIFGKLPIKIQAQAFYTVEQPDDFGQEWGFKLSITPVVKNPFAGLLE